MILHRACTIALAGILAGAFHSILHAPLVVRPLVVAPQPVPTHESPQGDTGSQVSKSTHAPLGLEINLTDAKKLYDQGIAFIDARRRDEFEAGRVTGAFWLPSDQLTGSTPSIVLQFLDASKPVVIYCGGGQCDASHNTAALLQQAGFTQTHVMTDGYPGWKDAGHPTESGKPIYE